MGYHGVRLLFLAVKLDGINTLFVAARAGFFVFLCLLRGERLRVLLENFKVNRVIQQACFVTGLLIPCMSCYIFLALLSAALLGVGCQGGLSYLTFLPMTDMVGVCPGVVFRGCSLFVDSLRNFHALEHLTCFLSEFPLKVPAL